MVPISKLAFQTIMMEGIVQVRQKGTGEKLTEDDLMDNKKLLNAMQNDARKTSRVKPEGVFSRWKEKFCNK